MGKHGKPRDVAIAGDRPETGVRILLEREKTRQDAPWEYTGAAHVPDASYPCKVTVTATGEVDVVLTGHPARELPEKIRLIVRTVFRQAEGAPPPWRIVRWRGEKGT